MNRRDLMLGVIGNLRITMLPGGRVRVEPQGVLAHPDMDVPVEEYASLAAFLSARGQPANDVPPSSSRLSPEAEARLIDLSDSLRAWSREDLRVRLCLGRHVRDGVPLTECLALLARLLGADGLAQVRARVMESEDPSLRAWLGPRRLSRSAQPTVVMELALPTDPSLDAFVSGDTEVDDYFRSRRWFRPSRGGVSPPTYVFRAEAGGLPLGYATVSFRRAPWPMDASTDTERTLTVYALGVAVARHGQRNPRAPGETYAVSILAALERMARDKADCVGVALWVRAANARAIGFYVKCGFVGDAGGPVQRDDRMPHLTMRKPFGR